MMTLRVKYDFPYFIYKLRLFQRNQSNLLTIKYHTSRKFEIHWSRTKAHKYIIVTLHQFIKMICL